MNTKEKIINSFADLLSQKPIDKITLRDVASSIDIGVSLVYKHFKNKEELVIQSFIYQSDLMSKNITLNFNDLNSIEQSLNSIINYSNKNISIFYLLMYLDYCSIVSKEKFDDLKKKYCHILIKLENANIDLSNAYYFVLLPLFKYIIDLNNEDTNLSKEVFCQNLVKVIKEISWKK